MLVFDLESDGLLDELTRIHCINIVDRPTGQRLRFNDQPEVTTTKPDGTIADALRLLAEAPEIAGQNVIAFDIPAIQKVYPGFKPRGRVHDTLVYSKLIWTNLYDIDQRAVRKRRRPAEFIDRRLLGRHSLEAWGYRLGDYKGEYSDLRKAEGKALGLTGDELDAFVWRTFTADMDDYCAQDVEVTTKLIEKVEAESYADTALLLEARVQEIIRLQEGHGFLFNVAEADRLAAELVGIRAELEDQLREAFSPWFEPERYKGQVVEMAPKRGMTRKVETEDGLLVPTRFDTDAPYTKIKLVSFEPGSRDKIANRLIRLFGWSPQEFTETGKPKVDETTLDGLEYPEAKLLKKYLTVEKRLGLLTGGKKQEKGWLNLVTSAGRIHGRVNTNGAVTGRMSHFSPNLAQVPKVKLIGSTILNGYAGGWGVEMRGLFIVPPGFRLVGVDAEGLELRMLGHYMARYDGGAYVEAVVHGDKAKGTDVHTVNMRLVGLRSRDSAKTWIYAYLYGAGNWKLGFIAYEDMSDEARAAFNRKNPAGADRDKALERLGGRGRARIEAGLPALGKLQEVVKATARSGTLRGLDGRRLHVRGLHSALNTLLQGGGAIVMKQALVLAYDALVARGWQHGREFAFVANVHDEFQIETEEHIAEEVGQIAADAIRRAGEHFGLRCPLAGSAQIGLTWADSH